MVCRIRSLSFVCLLSALFVLAALPAGAVTPYNQRQVSNSSQQETEPALVTYTHFGVEYSCSVWMNFDPNQGGTSNSTLKYGAFSSTGNSSTGIIPAVSGAVRYADPVLVKHPSLVRIYLAALVIKSGSYSIAVWTSANGGWNWSSPTELITASTLLDKPWIAFGPAPTAKFWVAWEQSNQLFLRGATHTGSPAVWTLDPNTVTIDSAANPSNAQVMVDSNEHVYVLYTSSPNSQSFDIKLKKWDGSNVTTLPSVSNVGALYVWNDYITVKSTGTVKVRAASCPSAKLDRAAGRRRIGVTWHDATVPGAANARIRFASYKLDVGTWSTGLPVFAQQGTYDVMPALDYNSSTGAFVVTWYTFPFESSAYTIRGKAVTFDGSGNPTWPAANDFLSSTVTGGDLATLPNAADGSRHLGEYHDVSYTNGRFKASHIIAPTSGNSEVWAFTVNQ